MPSQTTIQVHITPAKGGWMVTCIPDQHGGRVEPTEVKRFIATTKAEVTTIITDFLSEMEPK